MQQRFRPARREVWDCVDTSIWTRAFERGFISRANGGRLYVTENVVLTISANEMYNTRSRIAENADPKLDFTKRMFSYILTSLTCISTVCVSSLAYSRSPFPTQCDLPQRMSSPTTGNSFRTLYIRGRSTRAYSVRFHRYIWKIRSAEWREGERYVAKIELNMEYLFIIYDVYLARGTWRGNYEHTNGKCSRSSSDGEGKRTRYVPPHKVTVWSALNL